MQSAYEDPTVRLAEWLPLYKDGTMHTTCQPRAAIPHAREHLSTRSKLQEQITNAQYLKRH